MFALIVMLAMQGVPEPTTCDSALFDRPVRTPTSVPPAIIERRAVLEAIEREAGSLDDLSRAVSVAVWFLIDQTGRVAEVKIGRSSGNIAADRAGLRLARTFRFAPAIHNGERVCAWVQLPIRFRKNALVIQRQGTSMRTRRTQETGV